MKRESGIEGDLIDRIFFSPPPLAEETDDETPEDKAANEMTQDDSVDLGLEDEESENDVNPALQNSRPSSSAVSSTATPSLEELQKAQREQMEEAIGMMAAQMKEATQGIQSQIKQQTDRTLTELESTVEQNFEDVKQVTQNVQTHNQKRSRQNWATYTLLAMIAGTFVLCMMTIWTAPKRPNTCLILCRGDGKDVSLIGWVGTPIWVVGRSIVDTGQTLWDEYGASLWAEYGEGFFGDSEKGTIDENSDWRKPSKEWEQVYGEIDQGAKQKGTELDELLRSLDEEKEKKRRGESANNKDKNDIGSHKLSDLNHFNSFQDAKPRAHPKDAGIIPDLDAFGDFQAVQPQAEQKRKVAQKPKEKEDNPFAGRRFGDRQPNAGADDPFGGGRSAEPGRTSNRGGPKLSEAQLRVSPKDVRSAADKGDLAKLKAKLDLRPEFIDRTDKNGWSALHFAVRKGRTEAVQLLLERGCEINAPNKSGDSPLDLAVMRLGPDHPIIDIIQEAGGIGKLPIEKTEAVPETSAKPSRVIGTVDTSVPDASDKHDYVDHGRRKLNQLGSVAGRPTRTASSRLIDESEDHDNYLQTGRNRLDSLLAKSTLTSGEL